MSRPGSTRISLAGDFTIHSSAEQKGSLMDAMRSGTPVELDLSAVTELDTAGLQILLMAIREAAEQGTACELTGVMPAIAGTLAIAGLDPCLRPLGATGQAPTETTLR